MSSFKREKLQCSDVSSARSVGVWHRLFHRLIVNFLHFGAARPVPHSSHANRFLRYIAAATFSFFLAIASPASGAEQAIVPLTPQQEAFFPKNDPIDEEFWKRFTSPSQFNETWQIHKKLGSRFRYIFFGTVYAGLCNASCRQSAPGARADCRRLRFSGH